MSIAISSLSADLNAGVPAISSALGKH
jgi:hypothetical protein